MKNIVLIGMPGCGKSTIGRRLAELQKKVFYDLDEIIEFEQGVSISQIFEDKGEAVFRELESNVIKRLCKPDNTVIATGGGAVVSGENAEHLKSGGILVFVNRPINKIILDIKISHRPLLSGDHSRDRLYYLYEQRLPIYKGCADFEIQNDCPLPDVIGRIISEVCKFENSGY